MFSSTKLLLNAFCSVINAVYLAGIKLVMGVKRLVFPLSNKAHDFFFVLFNSTVEEAYVVFAKVLYFQLIEAILQYCLKYLGSDVLVCSYSV